MVAALLSGGSVPGVPLGQLGRRRVPVEVVRVGSCGLEHLRPGVPLVRERGRDGVLQKPPEHGFPVDRSEGPTCGLLTLEQ